MRYDEIWWACLCFKSHYSQQSNWTQWLWSLRCACACVRVGTEANRAGRLWFFLSSPATRLTSHCTRDAMEQADQVEQNAFKCIQSPSSLSLSPSPSFYPFLSSLFPWPFSLSFLSFPSPDTSNSSNTSNQDKEATCRTIPNSTAFFPWLLLLLLRPWASGGQVGRSWSMHN